MLKHKLFTLLVALCATTALWAENTITYTATEKLGGYNGSLDIGETTFGSPITSHTFSNGTGTITCVGEITKIGYYAFYYCYGLTSVTIPNSVTTIEDWAFEYCSGLTSIDVDAANTHYASVDGVLFNYAKDTLIQYPIGNPRTEYTIPNSVTTIESFAFVDCSGLTSVTIGNSVTEIGYRAFWKCSGLTSVTIPNSVTTIGDEAFYNCSGLTSVTIPNSVTTIGEETFYGCRGLTSITIPNSVTTIGEGAFADCSGLTSVTIPNSVTTIEEQAFYYCTGLTSINVDAANTHYASIDGVLFNYAKDTLIQYPIGNPRTEYTIPNSVTTIGESAFEYCSGLTSVTIPNSVITIGIHAFYNCYGLTSVTIPNSVTTIGDWAFAYCYSLTSITIPNSVTTIGSSAFTLVNNIVYDGTATGSPWGAKCVNGYVDGYFVYGDAAKTKLYGCSSAAIGEITIPNSVITIGKYAFVRCESLTSVTIGNSVTTIGEYAFCNCSGLTSITIPNSVTTIGNDAFGGCEGLTSITIPNSVTTIEEQAFYGCSGLTSINVDVANTHYASIDGVLFNYAKDTLIQYPIGNPRTEYTIPNSVTTIGESAFEYCSGLTSVTIPNSVTTIGESAFVYCSGLTSVTIPNSVTSIDDWAFGECSSLNEVTIGNSVKTIGSYAFARCKDLTSLICEAATPPTCGRSCFSDVDKSIPLYVPAGSIEAYQVTEQWKDFTDIRPITAKDVEVTEIEAEPTESAVEIAWPSVVNAETYTIEIRLGDQLICSIVFNAEGQLVSINFNLAPGRGGHTYATTAEDTATGWAYTIAGLNPGTKYTYSVTAKDASEQVIDTKSGTFTTQGMPMDVESVHNAQCTMHDGKFLQNGQVIIRQGNKTYNVVGQEL